MLDKVMGMERTPAVAITTIQKLSNSCGKVRAMTNPGTDPLDEGGGQIEESPVGRFR
jgi:hypothetical protein